MNRYVAIFLAAVVVDFFFYSATFVDFQVANTKQMLAVLGAMMLFLNSSRNGGTSLDKSLLVLSMYACLFSLVCFVSVVYNRTYDYVYCTYIGSMWTWLFAAYAAIQVLKSVHEKVTFEVVSNYLVCICVAQCIIALLIDNNEAFANFVNSIFTHWDRLEGERLYGIGCQVDVAGTRFSAVAIILAGVMTNVSKSKSKLIPLYLIAYCMILVVGNMISRTTTVGCVLALVIMILLSFFSPKFNVKIWWWFLGIVICVIPILTFLYNTDRAFHHNMRFGFEGFFSLVEKGHWETHSNNQLERMIVWPDNLKTWIIGDGYFSFADQSPYYIGDDHDIFYKSTDIGWCRFIFYSGIIGISTFALYFLQAARLCMEKFRSQRIVFLFLFFLTLAIWAKVATDIFLVFALYLWLDDEEDDEEDGEDADDEYAEDVPEPMVADVNIV